MTGRLHCPAENGPEIDGREWAEYEMVAEMSMDVGIGGSIRPVLRRPYKSYINPINGRLTMSLSWLT